MFFILMFFLFRCFVFGYPFQHNLNIALKLLAIICLCLNKFIITVEEFYNYIYLHQRKSTDSASKEQKIKFRFNMSWQDFGRTSSQLKDIKYPICIKENCFTSSLVGKEKLLDAGWVCKKIKVSEIMGIIAERMTTAGRCIINCVQ